jgi:hypothetical protein
VETEVDNDLAVADTRGGIVTVITSAGNVRIMLGGDFCDGKAHAATGTVEKNI